MFGFLKKKLKDTIDKIGEDAEKTAEVTEAPAETTPEPEPTPEPKQTREEEIIQDVEDLIETKDERFEDKFKEVKEDLEKKQEELSKEEQERRKNILASAAEKIKEAPKEQKGLFSKIKQKVTTVQISEEKFDELFEELELTLLENNVALEVIEKIKDDLKEDIVKKPIKRGSVTQEIRNSLRLSIQSLFFESSSIDLMQRIDGKKPYVILFVGINGSGKTTSIAKFAKMLKDEGKSVVVSASDTFRAAAIQQLEAHTTNLGIKLIKHDYGSDPAAVAFDAIKYAHSKAIDVVLVDTAGRLQSNTNLMQEMQKIVRVAKPDLKLFVGESITGNDCVEQARQFNEAVGIDGIILSKADVDEKGGAAISASYVTKKPILYLGTGQNYSDLTPFSSTMVVNSLGLSET